MKTDIKTRMQRYLEAHPDAKMIPVSVADYFELEETHFSGLPIVCLGFVKTTLALAETL